MHMYTYNSITITPKRNYVQIFIVLGADDSDFLALETWMQRI